MSSLYVMAYVRTYLKVNQRNKWVPLFVGNYEARFSTRKINDKITERKNKLKMKNFVFDLW